MKKLLFFFLIISFSALTQEVAEDIEEVIAVGQKAGLKSALKKQQDSDSVISVIDSDGLGQFPEIDLSHLNQ